jgi:hypothetical protein
MRLKITHALSGSIDGIQLSHFVVGQTYEVGSSLGSFLLAIGAAESAGNAADDREQEEMLVGVRRTGAAGARS